MVIARLMTIRARTSGRLFSNVLLMLSRIRLVIFSIKCQIQYSLSQPMHGYRRTPNANKIHLEHIDIKDIYDEVISLLLIF